jgi:translocation and assembly module TamA
MRVFHLHRAWLAVLAACGLLLAAPAAARIRVELEGIDGAVRRNVLALLSVERYKDRERIEPDAVNRLFRRVDDEVRSALRPFGYYEPQISAVLTPEERTRDWRVRLRIDTGPPVLVTTVDVVVRGPGAEDEVFRNITAAPGMRPGDRLEHAAYEQLKGNLQRAAATFGYLDARMQRSELAVDTLQHRASIHLELDTGERYRFGATTIQQEAVRSGRIRRFLRYQEGEPYDAGKLLRTQFALDDSQYFSTVQVLPGERDVVTQCPSRSALRARRTSARRRLRHRHGRARHVQLAQSRVNTCRHRLGCRCGLRIKQTFDARTPFGDPALEKFSLNLTASSRDQRRHDIVEARCARAHAGARPLAARGIVAACARSRPTPSMVASSTS